ncbi:MAG: hypothetical protein PHY93_17430 [Bacteriovorax sp.]|nr:hypothetical protein [Bacteriovorax sp.]
MHLITIFAILLFLTSCAQLKERTPASFELRPTLEDVMSISATEKSNESDTQIFSSAQIKSLFKEYQLIESTTLNKNTAYKIEFELKEGVNRIKVFYAKGALKDLEATMHMITFLKNLDSTPGRYTLLEMYFNALQDDPIALDNFLKLKGKKNESLFYSQPKLKEKYENYQEELARRYSETLDQRNALKEEIKKLAKERSPLEKTRKDLLFELDKAIPDEQLKNIIARNDRKAAADLLKKYLPFETMAHVEKQFWNDYLEIIQNPLPLEDRIFAYRGINEDIVYSAQVNGVELDRELAIKENKAFLMSPILVKNQGSWNRRLRSLGTMNKKFIGTIEGSDEVAQSARITTMFANHSKDPMGSPFLSFTPDFKIATKADGMMATDFGSKRVSAFLIDPRLLQYNYATIHDEEIEFLTNLFTFPDELVGIWDINYHQGEDPKSFLDQKLKQLIDDKFGEKKNLEVLKKIYRNTRAFYAPVFDFVSPIDLGAEEVKATDPLKIYLDRVKLPLPKIPLNCNQAIGPFLKNN